MGLCDECTKRAFCKDLCPEAELYAKQDEVYLREKTIGLPIYSKEWPKSKEKPPFLTKIEKKIANALLDGKSRGQIAQELDITKKLLRWHIHNIKRKRLGKFTNSMEEKCP